MDLNFIRMCQVTPYGCSDMIYLKNNENIKDMSKVRGEFKTYLARYNTIGGNRQYTTNDFLVGNSKTVYQALFGSPVIKLLFYWGEDDYQGSLFVVHHNLLNNTFFYTKGIFGSCEGDDYFEICETEDEFNEKLNTVFNNGSVVDHLDKIELDDYSHPKLIAKWSAFKTKKNN